ncbi:hypothetical protein ILUMI_24596 [Ignelater luminosus]|uniref:Uncharacterized protein n=1 Tax=Ignelater luminosus TaxID=2038154 RepID=A0A8K0CA71_IGNLU|nr:hypothetical protein ILUMI_24596 [Ignelater luminosus]
MEESNANDDPYSFDGYDSDVDKEYLPSDLEERNEGSISTSSEDTQKETVEESVGRQAEVNLNERAKSKKGKLKEDRWDVCELNKLCTEEDRLTDEDKSHYQNHILEKNAAREERQKDREGKTAVLTFDLQNVLTCPKAEISKFFYKSKLSVSNLSAHLSITKQVYCALWNEYLIGRKGDDLASALYKILQNVIEDHPNLEEIILWSDSCVPQNRNSIMSFAF